MGFAPRGFADLFNTDMRSILMVLCAFQRYTEVKDGCRQIHVEAIAHITDPKELKDTISNEFQFTFEIQGETPPLRRMLPATPSLARRMAERILAESDTWQDPENAQATQQQQQQKATATVYDGPPGKEGSAGDMY